MSEQEQATAPGEPARRSSAKERKSITLHAPGFVPDATNDPARVTASAAAPSDQIWEAMRKKTAKKAARKTLAGQCWSGFWCLVPDVVEDAGAFAGKGLMKATINTMSILGDVLSLDADGVQNTIRGMVKDIMPDDDSKYAYNPDVGKLPGRLTDREMIYCARLSLLAYMTADVSYDSFFPKHREKEIVDRIFDPDCELPGYFVIEYVASLFDQNETNTAGSPNPRFGYAKGIANGLTDMNMELVYPFDVNHNQGFIAKSKDFEQQGGDIVVAFQGTAERNDFITSLHGTTTPFEPLYDGKTAGAMPCLQGRCGPCLGETAEQKGARIRNKPLGRVHVGFYNAFLSLKDIIQTNLEILMKDVANTEKAVRIVVTGHSLGGALATICTAWLMQWFRYEFPGGLPNNFRVLSVTFGQPKVGNDDFVANIDKDEWTNWTNDSNAKFKTYRIFTPLDPVVTTPPVTLGFRHCYAMCLMRDGKLYFLPPSLANKVDRTTDGTFYGSPSVCANNDDTNVMIARHSNRYQASHRQGYVSLALP